MVIRNVQIWSVVKKNALKFLSPKWVRGLDVPPSSPRASIPPRWSTHGATDLRSPFRPMSDISKQPNTIAKPSRITICADQPSCLCTVHHEAHIKPSCSSNIDLFGSRHTVTPSKEPDPSGSSSGIEKSGASGSSSSASEKSSAKLSS